MIVSSYVKSLTVQLGQILPQVQFNYLVLLYRRLYQRNFNDFFLSLDSSLLLVPQLPLLRYITSSSSTLLLAIIYSMCLTIISFFIFSSFHFFRFLLFHCPSNCYLFVYGYTINCASANGCTVAKLLLAVELIKMLLMM